MKLHLLCLFVILQGCQLGRPRPLLAEAAYLERLDQALDEQIKYLAKKGHQELSLAGMKIKTDLYRLRLVEFKSCLRQVPPATLDHCLDQFFYAKKIAGKSRLGDALVTGYYLPRLKASKVKTAALSRPLYSLPQAKFLRMERKEIDIGMALAKEKLELGYVSPIDAYILHIQGSGQLQFEDGSSVLLGHAGNNQMTYQSLGKLLQDEYPIEQMNWPWIENYLAKLNPEQLDLFLAKNPRYIYFRVIQEFPRTTANTGTTALITSATDQNEIPLGIMAILSFGKKMNLPLIPKMPFLILTQDTGGGIKGPGRIDLYLGEGLEAKHAAEHLRGMATLLVMLPKEKLP